MFELEDITTGKTIRVCAQTPENKRFWVTALLRQCADKGRWRRRRGAVGDVKAYLMEAIKNGRPSHYLSESPAVRGPKAEPLHP